MILRSSVPLKSHWTTDPFRKKRLNGSVLSNWHTFVYSKLIIRDSVLTLHAIKGPESVPSVDPSSVTSPSMARVVAWLLSSVLEPVWSEPVQDYYYLFIFKSHTG